MEAAVEANTIAIAAIAMTQVDMAVAVTAIIEVVAEINAKNSHSCTAVEDGTTTTASDLTHTQREKQTNEN